MAKQKSKISAKPPLELIAEMPRGGAVGNDLVFSRDGKLLAGCSHDKTVHVWDTEQGKRLIHVKAHTGPAEYVAFSPSAKLLASTAQIKQGRAMRVELLIWDVTAGTVLQQMVFPAEEKEVYPGPTMFSLSGNHVVCSIGSFSGENDHVVIVNAKTGKVTRTIFDQANPLASTPDGRQLIGFNGDQLMTWSFANGKQTKSWTVAEKSPIALQYSADGKTLAVTNLQGEVRLLSSTTGRRKKTLKDEPNSSLSLQFSSTGDRLGTVNDPETGASRTEARIWNLKTGQTELSFDGNLGVASPEMISKAVFSPDLTMFANCGQKTRLWRVPSVDG